MESGVEKGFNSDIVFSGRSYHIQTEDWGMENPYLVSRVFCDGAVVKSFKTPYGVVLPKGPTADRAAIRYALRCQHEQILDLLVSGQLIG